LSLLRESEVLMLLLPTVEVTSGLMLMNAPGYASESEAITETRVELK
jgi:hypothetical protein